MIWLIANALIIFSSASGNFLVVGSTVSAVIGLTWGGSKHPWSSAEVLIPLIIGLGGIVVFMGYEAKFAKNPLVPFACVSVS